MIINKIIAVEGLDKTGKSTFCNTFESIFSTMHGLNKQTLVKHSFPNSSSPIGKYIRNELNTTIPNTNIVNSPNFLAEMGHYWMNELYNNQSVTKLQEIKRNNLISSEKVENNINYLFDRYFLSTLAYQAFFNNDKTELAFIKFALKNNQFIKMPTDIIFLDLPNDEILRRTKKDNDFGLNDANDTMDVDIINKRRDAFKSAIKFLNSSGITIHWFEDSGLYSPEDLSKILMGKIFK